ncbi:MAG: family 16 glycoside hydrolase [Rubripirellula sp.]
MNSDEPSEHSDSLDRDVTRNQSFGENVDGADSLDRDLTAGEIASSSSDISQFDEGWEQTGEAQDLGTRYQIDAAIGHGGMGEVYRGTDNRLKRPVAIKRLKGDLSANRRAVERFSTEAEAVARLNHFNIVQIYDVGRDAEGHFIVMELVDGQSLSEILKDSGPVELTQAIEFSCQLCDALAYAHSQGIVHRDVKPANILINHEGTPKLTDFGLARLESNDHGQTRAGAVLGTLDFMPPEQHRDASRADAKSDQWALAATFYQMVTGDSPRVIRSERLPESVRSAVLKALEENPANRFEDCRGFREKLSAAITTQANAEVEVRKLTRGQCTKCSHINASEMTFCEACGESLMVACPACQQSIGVWATFCGKCGADTESELKTKLTKLATQRKEIDSLRRGYRHTEAIEQLEAIGSLTHPAFAEHQQWALVTADQYRDELKGLEQQRDEILKAVSDRMKHHDLDGALKLLDRIPKPLSNPRIEALRSQVVSKAEQVQSLGAEIRGCVAAKKLDGLIPKIEAFLQLRPADQKAKKLLEQLKKREQKQQRQQEMAHAAEHQSQMTASHDDSSHVYLSGEPSLAAELPGVASQMRPIPQRKRLAQKRKLHTWVAFVICAVLVGLASLTYFLQGDRAAIVASDASQSLPDVTTRAESVEAVSEEPVEQKVQEEVASDASATALDSDLVTQAAPPEATSTTELDFSDLSVATEASTPANSEPANVPEGWRRLFDGKSLNGWTAVGPPTLWRVEAGAIVGSSVGKSIDTNAYLVFDQPFLDFTFKAKFKLASGNSGIQFRSKVVENERVAGYQMDLVDTERMGNLYDEYTGRGLLATARSNVQSAYLPNAWNDCELRVEGGSVQMFLNGTLAVSFGETIQARVEEGVIALQLHAGDTTTIKFKDLMIKELAAGRQTGDVAAVDNLSLQGDSIEANWTSLLRGRALTGWNSLAPETWSLSNGVLRCSGKTTRHTIMSGGACLFTRREYRNFVMRFDYRLASNGNSGVFLRVPGNLMSLKGILEISLMGNRSTSPNVRSGAVFGVVGPSRVLDRPVGQWNEMEIRADGPRIKVTLNDEIALFVDLRNLVEYNERPLWRRDSGRIGLQHHNCPVEFRNLRIQELP